MLESHLKTFKLNLYQLSYRRLAQGLHNILTSSQAISLALVKAPKQLALENFLRASEKNKINERA